MRIGGEQREKEASKRKGTREKVIVLHEPLEKNYSPML